MPETLAQKVRAKYPGVYNQLSDADLETRILAKYPGAYEGVPRTGAAAVAPETVAGPVAPSGDIRDLDMFQVPWRGIPKMLGAFGSDLVSGIPALFDVARANQFDPWRTGAKVAEGMVGQQVAQFPKAAEAARAGRASEAVGYTTAGLLPIVGPQAARIGETAGTGQIPEAVGQLGALLTMLAGPKSARALPESVTVPPLLRHPNPQMADAVAAGLERGIPIDLGVASGNRAVQALESGAEHTLAGSLASRSAAQRTAGALTTEAEALQGRAFPYAVTPESAGTEALAVPPTFARARHGEANQAYTRLRALEGADEATTTTATPAVSKAVGKATAEEAQEIRRMLAELEEVQYTRKGMHETTGQGSTKEWTSGHRNAYVYEDIVNETGGLKPKSAAHLRASLERGLTGENSVWFNRAIKVAQKRLAGDKSVHPPLLPEGAGAPMNYSTMQAPVDLAPSKARLAPITKALEDQLSVLEGLPGGMRLGGADRAAADTLANVRRLMQLPDLAPASAVDPLLSSLKKYASAGESPLARTRGQGVIAGVIGDLEKALNQSLEQIGPDAVESLAAGRAATKAKYGALDVGKELGKKPVGAYRRLVAPEQIDLLRKVAKLEPNLPPVLARAWLQRGFDLATSEGGFKHAAKLKASWRKLSPETKEILFRDPAYVKDLDRFFNLAAELTTEFNPSRSGTLAVAVGSVGGLAWAPVQTILTNLGAAGFATAMRSPRFVKALTEGMRLPVRARAARAAAFEQAMLAAREAGAAPGAAIPALAEERPDTPGTPTRPPSGSTR